MSKRKRERGGEKEKKMSTELRTNPLTAIISRTCWVNRERKALFYRFRFMKFLWNNIHNAQCIHCLAYCTNAHTHTRTRSRIYILFSSCSMHRSVGFNYHFIIWHDDFCYLFVAFFFFFFGIVGVFSPSLSLVNVVWCWFLDSGS